MSSLQPGLYIHAIIVDGHGGYTVDKFEKFWALTILPTTLGAMVLSFVLKPKREDWRYKLMLYLQYSLFGLVGSCIALFRGTKSVTYLGFRFMVWVALFYLSFRVRRRIARLSDKDLNDLLTHVVLKGGGERRLKMQEGGDNFSLSSLLAYTLVAVLITMAQLAFLVFSSVQCESEINYAAGGTFKNCNRTLYAQTGIGLGVVTILLIKIISSLAPKRLLDIHALSMKQVVGLRMNYGDTFQAFCLSVSVSCALYYLGNYGAEGDFNTYSERIFMFTLGAIGGGAICILALWKLIVIRVQINREAEFGPQSEDNSPIAPLTEASSFWFYVGVASTSLLSTGCVIGAITMDDTWKTLTTLMLPFVFVVYVGALYGQSRKECMWKLWLHFASAVYVSEGAWMVKELRRGAYVMAALHVLRAILQTALFRCGLMLRSVVGMLPDKDLENFIVNTMFTGGLHTLFSCLFLGFRVTTCMVERSSLEACSGEAWCATNISVYICFWWLTTLVQASVKVRKRKSRRSHVHRPHSWTNLTWLYYIIFVAERIEEGIEFND